MFQFSRNVSGYLSVRSLLLQALQACDPHSHDNIKIVWKVIKTVLSAHLFTGFNVVSGPLFLRWDQALQSRSFWSGNTYSLIWKAYFHIITYLPYLPLCLKCLSVKGMNIKYIALNSTCDVWKYRFCLEGLEICYCGWNTNPKFSCSWKITKVPLFVLSKL